MTLSSSFPFTKVEYPESDGQPLAESDATRDYLLYAVAALTLHFQERNDVYIAGNLFIYYEQGNPRAVVAPDVFVIFGVPKKKRRSYKVWEENSKTPDFVLEVTSKTTVSEDQGTKKGLYAFLGVQEYFQYDPTGDYLEPQLKGYRLVEGNYLPLQSNLLPDGIAIFSQTLGLELQLQAGEMRFYNSVTKTKLPNFEELDRERRETEQARQEAEQARREAEQAMREEQTKAQKLAAKLRELGIDPDTL